MKALQICALLVVIAVLICLIPKAAEESFLRLEQRRADEMNAEEIEKAKKTTEEYRRTVDAINP